MRNSKSWSYEERKIMRKHFKTLSVFAFFIGFLLLAEVSGVNSGTFVTNVSLEKKKDFTYFTIFSKDKVEFKHFILPPKGDRPDRIVVDLKNAVHKLPQYNYRDLPWNMITAIRTSQYQSKPEKITRIVLDLKEPVVYRIIEQKKKNEITLAISIKKGAPSFYWAAVPEKIKTEKETLKKSDIQRKDKKEFASKEVVTTPERKVSKVEVKSSKKDQPKPEEFPKVIEKPPFKGDKPSTPHIEVKKGKDKELVEKGIEVEKVTPEPEQVAELPKEEKIEKTQAEEPKAGPVMSMDSLILQKAISPEPQKERGVAERESLAYENEGRRDPFIPLSQEIDLEFGEVPLPSVENLKLVGTLEDGSGYKALLEDDRGYGYLLKGGDRVKNGYVVNVFQNKIFFQIEEYGWSRVISLELPPEY
ncbi:MAG: AMIN domain-containing protein [Candidatus Zixiibacteriota bacterium]